MRLILIPIGSAGDVHPYIGIGRELKRRGHRVTMFTNDYFKALAENAGLEFVASSSAEDFKSALEDPKLWDPAHAFEFVARLSFLPLIPVVYNFLKENFVSGQTLAVGSSLAWGARIAQEKLGIPLVTLHLQPSVLMSLYDTPVYSQGAWLSHLPRVLKKGYLGLASHITDRITAPEINQFRTSVGLKPVRKILRSWTHSPLETIGLFPEWFAPPQPDWPPMDLTGFPLYDVDDIQKMPPEVDTFLNAGPAPVVFTAGSANKQAREMFKMSVEACVKLGCRGLIINQFPDQIPSPLPKNVMSASYAPFSQLFRRAAVVVHHGGIGTTAQTFSAGVPHLVTPFAHDQFDNASRVSRLGVGEQILPKNYRLKNVVNALSRLMNDQALRARAVQISRRLNGPEAITKTCDLILNKTSGACSRSIGAG